jgi:hypothetical protein
MKRTTAMSLCVSTEIASVMFCEIKRQQSTFLKELNPQFVS